MSLWRMIFCINFVLLRQVPARRLCDTNTRIPRESLKFPLQERSTEQEYKFRSFVLNRGKSAFVEPDIEISISEEKWSC